MTWQPIETAPDREEVLIWEPLGGEPDGMIYIAIRYPMQRGDDPPGWYESGNEISPMAPSHWMPLPDPPA